MVPGTPATLITDGYGMAIPESGIAIDAGLANESVCIVPQVTVVVKDVVTDSLPTMAVTVIVTGVGGVHGATFAVVEKLPPASVISWLGVRVTAGSELLNRTIAPSRGVIPLQVTVPAIPPEQFIGGGVLNISMVGLQRSGPGGGNAGGKAVGHLRIL
jgi:hypothetical protein